MNKKKIGYGLLAAGAAAVIGGLVKDHQEYSDTTETSIGLFLAVGGGVMVLASIIILAKELD